MGVDLAPRESGGPVMRPDATPLAVTVIGVVAVLVCLVAAAVL